MKIIIAVHLIELKKMRSRVIKTRRMLNTKRGRPGLIGGVGVVLNFPGNENNLGVGPEIHPPPQDTFTEPEPLPTEGKRGPVPLVPEDDLFSPGYTVKTPQVDFERSGVGAPTPEQIKEAAVFEAFKKKVLAPNATYIPYEERFQIPYREIPEESPYGTPAFPAELQGASGFYKEEVGAPEIEIEYTPAGKRKARGTPVQPTSSEFPFKSKRVKLFY